MLSPSADPEVPMDYSTEYDKSSIDDSDEACSIPGSFSPDNNQDGTSGDQRYEENTNMWRKTTKKSWKECYRNGSYKITQIHMLLTDRLSSVLLF